MVPDIKGALRSLIANNTDAARLYQSLRRSDDHSMMTIIVSIAIHKVSTNEKLVKKLRLNPAVSSTINVIRNESGSNIVAIKDSRNHTNNKIVKNTSTIVCIAVFPRSP